MLPKYRFEKIKYHETGGPHSKVLELGDPNKFSMMFQTGD